MLNEQPLIFCRQAGMLLFVVILVILALAATTFLWLADQGLS